MMHHGTKYNPLAIASRKEAPMATMQVVSVPCFHCHRITRFPVPPEYVDWKIIAEEYRGQLNKMISRFDKIVTDIDVMQPEDNPVRAYLSNEWAMLALEIRKHFEK